MSAGELILYTTEDGLAKIQLKADNGTVWLTQAEIATLFQTTKQNVSLHINNILDEGELLADSTVKESLTVQNEGGREVKRMTYLYSLEMILAIGYRISSPRGTQFRQWATTTLQEYLIKGFAMDDARLKDPKDQDYFTELLERIREIRASEKRFYQKVKDLYTLSVDYDPKASNAKLFFKTVQNKLLWSVTGKTAAELLVERSNPSLPHMGLQTWDGPKVRKKDVSIAKNYLQEDELTKLNRLVTMFLDYAEDQCQQRIAIYMRDWEDKLDRFLEFNNRAVLNHAGSISHDNAEHLVHKHYEEFDQNRKQQELEAAELEAIQELEQIALQIKHDDTKDK
jgi:hypothetical protein